MRVLIEVGYRYLLLGDTPNVGAVLQGLEGARIVEQDGYESPTRYKPITDEKLAVQIIANDSISLPENQDGAVIDRLLAVTKERDELRSKNYGLEKALKEIKSAVAPEEKK